MSSPDQIALSPDTGQVGGPGGVDRGDVRGDGGTRMMSRTSDGGLRRAVEAVERGALIILTPKRMVRRAGGGVSRGSPAVVARGLTRVQYPGEEPRELQRL